MAGQHPGPRTRATVGDEVRVTFDQIDGTYTVLSVEPIE
jgi:hypothetical protein